MNTCIMALGTFDGVHLGHKALLQAAAKQAKKSNIDVAAFTFDKHPQQVLTGRKVGLLMPTETRIELLKQNGAGWVAVEPFEDILSLSPEQFIELLIEKYRVQGLVCGEDYRFGKGGAGDAKMLKVLAGERGVSVQVLPFLLSKAGEKISSGQIRRLIEKGNVDEAATLLGRPFFVEGAVGHGKGLAHQWGTPTINLSLPQQMVYPRFAVYQTRVSIEGKQYDGVTNVGCRPTFDDGKTPNIETYILGHSFENIAYAKVEFIRFIRPEQKFADEKSLQNQIAKDIACVKELCS